MPARRRFQLVLVKPSHYDDDGYVIRIVAAEQRGARTKKKLEPDPMQVENVRLMFRLARVGGEVPDRLQIT